MNTITKQDLLELVNAIPDDAVIVGYSSMAGEPCEVDELVYKINEEGDAEDFGFPDATHVLYLD